MLFARIVINDLRLSVLVNDLGRIVLQSAEEVCYLAVGEGLRAFLEADVARLISWKDFRFVFIYIEPSSGCLRPAFDLNANREEVDRGADTLLFGFKRPPSLPPSYEHFGTSFSPVSPYREKGANRPSKTQALMRKCSVLCS